MFYFDIMDGGSVGLDDEGTALLDRDSARAEALQTLTEIFHHRRHQTPESLTMRVRDESGPFYEVTLMLNETRLIWPTASVQRIEKLARF